MSPRPPAQVVPPMSRVDRVTARSLRESERRKRGGERRRASKADAEAWQALAARLTEAHQVTFTRIDWAEIEAMGQVVPSIPRDAVSSVARRKLQEYRPSLADNLLGRERDRRRELMEKVIEAVKADAELYARAKAEADAHNRKLALANEVRALNADAIAGVLKANGAPKALKDVIEAFSLRNEGARLVGQIDLLELDALPEEACRAGAGGFAWTPLTDAERAELQLNYACSAVLRVAVEVLQAAPIETVEVVARLCRPTGSAETDFDTVLHAKVHAITIAKAPLKKIAATTVLPALGARFDWTPSRGLAAIDLDDIGLAARRAAA